MKKLGYESLKQQLMGHMFHFVQQCYCFGWVSWNFGMPSRESLHFDGSHRWASRRQTKVPCSSYHHNAHPACLAFWVQSPFFFFIIWEEEMTIFIEETNIWTRSQGGDIFNCTKNRNPRRNAARNQSMTATIFTQATWVLKVKGAPGRFASHHEHWLQDHVTCWC